MNDLLRQLTVSNCSQLIIKSFALEKYSLFLWCELEMKEDLKQTEFDVILY